MKIKQFSRVGNSPAGGGGSGRRFLFKQGAGEGVPEVTWEQSGLCSELCRFLGKKPGPLAGRPTWAEKS